MVVNYVVKKKIGSSNLKGKLEMRRMKLLKFCIFQFLSILKGIYMTTVVSTEKYYYFNSSDVGNQLKYYSCQFVLGLCKGFLFKFSCSLLTWFYLVEALKR